MVFASITIEEHVREMWLPVMDNKNNSIINPSSRQVSDNKMRCLVKCLSLFGLGLNVFAGEDLKYLDEEEPKEAEPAKKKPASRKAAKPKEEVKQEQVIPEAVDLLCNVLISEKSVNGVVSTWAANMQEGIGIEKLKDDDMQDHYANLVDHRNTKLNALLTEIEDGESLSTAVNSASKHLKAIKAIDENEFDDIRSLFTQRKISIQEAANAVD
jgi:hypothetical protein